MDLRKVCQVLSQKNLTKWHERHRVKEMSKAAKTRSTASSIRLQIEGGGEKLWRHNDFRDEPFPAVAQTLSRLTRNGTLQRLSKGVYYRPAQLLSGRAAPAPRQSRNWQKEPTRSSRLAPLPPIY